jgi:hypothetical protein
MAAVIGRTADTETYIIAPLLDADEATVSFRRLISDPLPVYVETPI